MNSERKDTSSLGEFRRAWKPLIASAVGMGFGLSPLPPYASGIMASALEGEFGWARADILGTLMLVPVALLLLGRYVGRLVDRFGPRKVALASTAGLGLAQLLIAAIGNTLVGFYIGWVAIAVLALGTLPLTYAKVINGWFKKSRGLALGIALAATGISGAIFPFVLTGMVDAMGWRGGYYALAALPLLIALPVVWFWLEEPGEETDAEAAAIAATGIAVKPALRSVRFWTLAIASMVLAFGVSGLLPNLFPLLLDRGISEGTASQALAALAVSVTAGRVVSGFMLDRIWAPTVCAILVVPAIGALFLLSNPDMTNTVMVAAVVTLGLVAGAEFDLIAFMTVRYFGQRHFSELYGIQYAVFGLGAGFAPAVYGAIYDKIGSYEPVIHLSIGLLALGVLLNFTLGSYPLQYSPHEADREKAAQKEGAPATA